MARARPTHSALCHAVHLLLGALRTLCTACACGTGKICLNILYSDWNPRMDVKSVGALAIAIAIAPARALTLAVAPASTPVAYPCTWADVPLAALDALFVQPSPSHPHPNPHRQICLSLLSMLSSAKQKSRPPDNDSTVVMSQGQKTRNMQWEFHDDNC